MNNEYYIIQYAAEWTIYVHDQFLTASSSIGAPFGKHDGERTLVFSNLTNICEIVRWHSQNFRNYLHFWGHTASKRLRLH